MSDIEETAINAAEDAINDHGFHVPRCLIERAINAYGAALWQPVDDPAKVPRDEWIIIHNNLTGFRYPRLYHKKEAIGVNVAAWRPAVKPPSRED